MCRPTIRSLSDLERVEIMLGENLEAGRRVTL
jgi:hypothetical protein